MQVETIETTGGERRVLDVFGMAVEVLADGEQTGGAYTMYRIEVAPGEGTPPHVQSREDEAFYVLDGTFEVMRAGETGMAGPGEYVMIPRNVPHAFRNAGETPGRLLGIASPAGHERFFADVDRLAAAGAMDMDSILAVFHRHGLELLAG